MMSNRILLILLPLLIAEISAEDCNAFPNLIEIRDIQPKFVGVIKSYEISNLVSFNGISSVGEYFSIEVNDELSQLNILTTDNFVNYELENKSPQPTFRMSFNCTREQRSILVRVILTEVNNYAPEFSQSSYKIKIPTPIPVDFDLTPLLDNQVVVIDYDLYYNEIVFSSSGSDMFHLESVPLASDLEKKTSYGLKIRTAQQITQLDGNEVEFVLVASDTFPDNTKNSSVVIRVHTDPEAIFIKPPEFLKPLYKGELHANGTLDITEEISLDPSTYDENVSFHVHDDEFGLIELSSSGTFVSLVINQENVTAQVLNEKFVSFLIEARREGDRSGLTAVILDVVSNVQQSEFSFSKSVYEGKFEENNSLLEIDDIVFIGPMEGVTFEFSSPDAEFFTFEQNSNSIKVQLKTSASIEEILSKSHLIVAINAQRDSQRVAATFVVIKVSPVVVPQFDKSFYTGSVTNGFLTHDAITITEETFSGDIEVTVESEYFASSVVDRAIQLDLVNNAVIPRDMTLITFVIRVKDVSGERSSEALVIVKVENDESLVGSLLFEQSFYEGKVDENLSLDLPEIKINVDEGVAVGLSGAHAMFLQATASNGVVDIKIKNEFTFEQFANENYLQVSLTATHENYTSASTNVVIGIKREGSESDGVLVFNLALYEGTLDSELNLVLPTITINNPESAEIDLSGRHGSFFEFSFSGNELQIFIKSDFTFEQFEDESYLQVTITASRENYRTAVSNIIIEVSKKDIENSGSLAFNSTLYEGTINSDLELTLPSITLNSYEGVTVELMGMHKDFFTVTPMGERILIQLENGVTFDQFDSDLYLQLTLVASHESLRAATSNIILGIVRETGGIDDESLQFNEDFFEGKISQNLILTIPNITLNHIEDAMVDLQGAHGSLFTQTFVQNQLDIELKSDVTYEELADSPYLYILIIATHENFRSTSANLIIEIERKSMEEDSSAFERSLYIGSVNNQKDLVINPLIISSQNEFTNPKVIGTDEAYFDASIDQNIVTISLKQPITEDLMFAKTILEAQVSAEHNSTSISTNVVVTLPRVTEDRILRFESSYYLGSLTGSTLVIDDIVLEATNYHESVTFSLSGSDENLFAIEREENSVKLRLAAGFSEESLSGRVLLTVTVSASREEFVTAESVVFIHLNVIVSDVAAVEFESPVYVGSLSFDRILQIDRIKLLSADDTLSIHHSGEHSEKFQISSTARDDNSTEIEVTFIQQPINGDEKFFFFYIEAFKIGAPKTYASVIIEVVDKIQLEFDEIKYFGMLDGNQNLVIDPIQLNAVLASDNVQIDLSGGQSQFFRVLQTGDSLQVMKISSITEEVLLNNRYLWFYLEASGSSFYSTKSIVIIETPQPLIEPPIEECYDILDPTQPFFATGSYLLSISNDFKGYIATVRAQTTNTDVFLAYSVQFETSYLRGRLSINNGDLLLTEPINTGVYKMTVVASNTAEGKQAAANVTLRVTEAKVCDNGEELKTVEKTLSSVGIYENVIENEIMYARVGDCDYEIVQVSPSELEDYIQIDPSTKYIKNVKTFNRESDIFSGQHTPHVLVTLSLSCDTSKRNNPLTQSYSAAAEIDEILYSPTITYLSINILDQNDNFPVFTSPPYDGYVVGFPDHDLMELTMPDYLFKVEAYDIDEGLNAVISYNFSENSTTYFFFIDQVTGEIRGSNPLNDIFELKIVAIDRNGTGNRAEITLQVRTVDLTKAVEIVFSAENDSKEMIDLMSRQTDSDVRVLSSTILPDDEKLTIIPNVKMYIYAINEEKDLLSADEIVEMLSDVPGLKIYRAVKKYAAVDENCDLGGWILAVSLMGSFLGFFVIGLPLCYFLYLKPRLTGDKVSSFSKDELAEDFYMHPGSSTPVVSEVSENSARQSDADVIGIRVDGVTEDSSTSDAEQLSNKLMTYLDVESPTNEKKNVSFKETVERIEVFDDPEEENSKKVTDL